MALTLFSPSYSLHLIELPSSFVFVTEGNESNCYQSMSAAASQPMRIQCRNTKFVWKTAYCDVGSNAPSPAEKKNVRKKIHTAKNQKQQKITLFVTTG